MKWNLFLADGKKFDHEQHDFKQIEQYIGDRQTTFWLDIEQLSSEADDILEKVFHCHPLAIEDCHKPEVRPKIEKFDHNLFIVFRGINFNPGAKETDLINTYFIFGQNHIVTIHDQTLRAIKEVVKDLEISLDRLANNPGKILYETLDHLVDNYFPTLERLDERITDIEKQIFYESREMPVEEIFQIKKEVMILKRTISPQRDLLNSLLNTKWEFIREKNIPYYRDIRDHIDRLADHLDMYRDMTVSLLDSYMTQVSNKMNQVMKILSIVATIMLPLSLLTGIFGMNFEIMPALKWDLGFWSLMGFMALVSLGLFSIFKWKKWL